jgi:hypothetical protein
MSPKQQWLDDLLDWVVIILMCFSVVSLLAVIIHLLSKMAAAS